MGCRHQWEEAEKIYNPPVNRRVEVEGGPREFMEKIFYGITNITQRCTKCGHTEVTQVTGRVV